MSNITLLAVITAFAVITVFMLILQYRERKDLYDRIMADNLADYQSAGSKPQKRHSSAATEVLKRWRDRGENK